MKLFFRAFGQGKPLIILHGLFGMSDNWVSLSQQLSGSFHVFLPDLRNHGRSPHSHVHNYPAMVSDLDEFISENNITKPILIGHSMGGKVAMLYATEYPSPVDKLIVVDISPKRYDLRNQHLDILQTMSGLDFSRVHSRADADSLIRLSVADDRIRLFILKNLYRSTRNTFAWRVNLDAIRENPDLMGADISLPRPFPGPALFIRGGLSDYLSLDDIPIINTYFPDNQVKTIEKAGHWVHADAPEELLQLIRDFCGYQPEPFI
ncbi:MAG: alpha/beta fold hydrolase [Bacteroidetes bacterium]|nr:alpha/beta fold hydrolase [Bacteroidota bacterium]